MRIFGAALDAPNSPERVDLKLAYLSHRTAVPCEIESATDPYDVIKADLRGEFTFSPEDMWVGKMPIDSWLTPRPRAADIFMLNPLRATAFLEANGCWYYVLKVADFVEEHVFPHKPVMIGVDHSLTGGLLLALAKKYNNLNVVILDAHFDVMSSDGVLSFGKRKDGEGITWCHCGNFLSFVLENEIIRPENLWVLGVAEEMLRSPHANGEKEIRKWLSEGVHLLPKGAVSSGRVSLDLSGPTYVSIDMDVGSLSSVFSARFMNCFGLTAQQFLTALSQLERSIKKAGVPLVGMDIMEIDIHFLEAAYLMPVKDYTRYIARKALEILLRDETRTI